MVRICLGFLALLSITTTAAHPFAFPFTFSLRVLDIGSCASFDLTPLASCRDLRRLYTFENQTELDLKPLQGLMPRLQVKGGYRVEYLDARDL
jgi:hypothetical protein